MSDEEIQSVAKQAEAHYDWLKDQVHLQYDEIQELKAENERLNNVIDEIHKLLQDSYKELSSYLPTDDNCELMSRIANMIGKIKKLKGSDKE